MVRNGATKRRRGDIWAQLGVSACVLLIPPLVMAAGVMVFGSTPPPGAPSAVEQAAVAPQPTVAGGKSIAMAERPDGGGSFALASADQHPVVSEPLPIAEPHPVVEPAAASHPVNEPRAVTRQRQAAEQREAKQRQLAEQRAAAKQRQANERAAAELRATAEQRAGTEPSAALDQHAVAEQRPVTEPPAAARQRLAIEQRPGIEPRPAIEQRPTTEQRPAAGRRPASDQQAIAEPRPDAQQRPVTEPRPVAEPSQATVPAVHQLPPTEQRVAAVQTPSSVGGQSALKDPARYSGSAPTTAGERLPSADGADRNYGPTAVALVHVGKAGEPPGIADADAPPSTASVADAPVAVPERSQAATRMRASRWMGRREPRSAYHVRPRARSLGDILFSRPSGRSRGG
jgi:hypothetical protein